MIKALRNHIILVLLIFTSLGVEAQNQAANWYFGENAGLNFMTGNPVPVLTGALSTMEGCSSISTIDGSLRFYTDGSTVWDRHDDEMPNGDGLMGNSSSTQSGLIVPKPGSTNLFYIFTVDDVAHGNGGSNGLRYSLVDMNLNGFLGDVVNGEKNILLIAPLCEKVTAVGHANGTDIWVIAQKWNTNNFYSYLVTSSGVNTTPVVSSAGIVIQNDIDNAKGYLKVSPDGNTIAKANAGLKSVEIFGFNTTTGIISDQNIITDHSLGGEPYGIEFSPNGELLYVNTWKSNPGKILYQYNLEAPDVLGSRVQIATGTEGALQLAPDNRIYVAQNQGGSLSVINEPNNIGADCLFSFGSVSLGGKRSRWGLPPFIQSFFSFNPGFYFDDSCLGDSTQFHENSSSEPDSLIWDFGDGTPKSIEPDPLHLYTSTGLYFVKLTVWIGGIEGSVTHLVLMSEKAQVNLGNDTTYCSGDTLVLFAGNDAEEYLWHDGDTNNTFNADTTGLYWVKATIGTCSVYDSIDVKVLPSYFLQIDTTFCAGDSVYAGGEYRKTTGDYYDSLYNYIGCDSIIKTSLVVHDTFLIEQQLGICNGDSALLGGSYQKVSGVYFDHYQTSWGCDSTLQSELTVYDKIETHTEVGLCEGDSLYLEGEWQTSSGIFHDTLTSAWGCDSVSVTELTISDVIHAHTETDICQGDSAYADGDWQKTEGIYIDSTKSSGGCDSVHTLNLFVNDNYSINWDTLICEGDSIYAGGDYQTTPGTYLDYLLTIKGCDSTIQTQLSITLLPVVDLGKDTSIMDGKTLTLDASGTPNATYLWQDGSTNNTFQVTESGTYWVTVTSQEGCENSDTINVSFLETPVVDLGPDQGFCEGDTLMLEVDEGYASYLWQDSSTNNTYQVTEEGTYWVTVTSQDGCENSDTVYIYNDIPVVDLGPDQELCDLDTLTLRINEGYASYLWQDSSTNNTYQVTESGTYWVRVTSQAGCENSDTVHIDFLESPVVDLGPDMGFCEGDTLTLEVDEGYASYFWQDGTTNNVYQITKGGTYWVSVTNQDGCEGSDTVNIMNNTPYVFLGNDTTLLYGDSLILNAGSEGQEYTWQDGSSDQWFTVKEDGTYWVNVSNGECSASDTINVEFYGDCVVLIPNVFTPNVDGYNDEFFASYDEQVGPFKMSVFNRWGQTIFEANDINRHWDGKYKGTLVPEGVYYWVVEYYCYGAPDKQILKGSVTVIY